MRGFLDPRRFLISEWITFISPKGAWLSKEKKVRPTNFDEAIRLLLHAQSGGSVCPVSLLKIYLRKLDIDPHSNEFIFRTLAKTKSSYKLTHKNKPISYTTFRDKLAKSLKNVVPDPSVYGAHSFRWGGASRAANSGVNDRLFQKHGRWKSVAAKNGYIKDDISSRVSVSKSLGL